MAGLAAARDAIRDGSVAEWRAGIRPAPVPPAGLEPQAGDFSVRLSPRGQMVAFATGTRPMPASPPSTARGPLPGARRNQEDLRHRRVRLRIRSRPALVSCRHDRDDLAQPVDALRSRRAAARQPAGRALSWSSAPCRSRAAIRSRDRVADAYLSILRRGGADRRVRHRLGVRPLLLVQDAELGCADPPAAARAMHAGRRAGRPQYDRQFRRPPERGHRRRHVHPARWHGAAGAERRDVVDRAPDIPRGCGPPNN